MNVNDSFLPSHQAAKNVLATNIVQTVALPIGIPDAAQGNTWRSGGEHVRITNMAAAAGPNIFFETSNQAQSVLADITKSPIVLPQQTFIFRRAQGDDVISLIADAAGPVNVNICVGNGR